MADTCMHAVSLVARRHFLHEKTGAGAKGQVVDLQFLESRRASFVSSDSSGSDETQAQDGLCQGVQGGRARAARLRARYSQPQAEFRKTAAQLVLPVRRTGV